MKQSARFAAFIGFNPVQPTEWGMKTVLGFLVLALPAHQMALHFYYSARGTILASILAACFGVLLSWSLKGKNNHFQQTLTVLSPFTLLVIFYLVMPSQLNLLYSLVVVFTFVGFILQPQRLNILAGGRTELISRLQPFASPELSFALRRCFFLTAALSLISYLFFKLTFIHSFALLPLLAIAVSGAAMQNSAQSKEMR